MAPLRAVKLLILRAFRALNLFDLCLRSSWRRSRLVVLCFHGVSLQDEHEWNPYLYISPESFRRRMERLRHYDCNVLGLADALSRVRTGLLPPRSVAITFDDGLYDFLARAHPILREFGYPSTVYVTTHYQRYSLPVFDLMCDYLLWKTGVREVSVPGLDGQPLRVCAGSEGERRATLRRIDAQVAALHPSAATLQGLLESLAGMLGANLAHWSRARLLHLLTPEETRWLSAQGVDIQMHTHQHCVPLEKTEFEREITENRERILAATGRLAEHFCYPSGVHHPDFLPWLESLGVRSATTSEPGLVHAGTHALLLPRYLDGESVTEIEFDGWISGVSGWLNRNLEQRRRP